MQGCVFEGDTKGGKPQGSGKMRYPSGDECDGGWMDSYQHGEGTHTCPDGYVYMGNWKRGKKEGQGIEQYPSGSKYTGEFLDDLKHGEGTYQAADGRIYTGSWKKGKYEGLGELRFVDGSIYTGSWQKGKYEGLGELRWVNGYTYKGSFRNGLRDGYGVQTWPKGANITKYVGEWREGARCGSDGVYTRSDGSLCLGPIMRSPPQASTTQTVRASGVAQPSKPVTFVELLGTGAILLLILGTITSKAR